MDKYNYYKTFSTGLIDGILIREDKKIPTTQAEYYDNERNVSGEKWHQQTSLRRMINSKDNIEKHLEVRDGTMTEGYAGLSNIDTCVYDYLCRLELKPSFGGEIDYTYEFAAPFSDTINKLLLIVKWVAGIQSITQENSVEITKDNLKEISTMSPLQLHKAIKELFKDDVFGRNHYNYDDNILTLMVGGRDRKISEGFGYIKIKTTQYTGLLNNIMKHHDELIKERDAKVEIKS